MTAPDARQREELREALAEALRRVHRGAFVVTAAEEADALLPVITAWAESLARERAAEELRAFYVDLGDEACVLGRRGPYRIADWILDRGAEHVRALTADDQPVQP